MQTKRNKIFNNKLIKLLVKNEVVLYRFALIVIIIGVLISPQFSYLVNQKPILSGLENFYNSAEEKPVEANLLIGKDEDLAFLNETISKIFPSGVEGLSDEEKAIEIERFITAYLKQKNNIGNASKILKEGHAICGGKAYAFRILARKMQIPARYVGLYYTPNQGGHDLTEVYYDNSWHLFDPTYGIFVYSNPAYDKKGRILSMQELRSDPQTGNILQVVEKLWVGEYSTDLKKFGGATLRQDFLKDVYGVDFNQYWREEVSRAFPVVYGETSWVSLPVDVDLQKNNSVRLGEIDQSLIDMSIYDTRFKGFGYLGKSQDVPGVYNTWSIKVDAPADIKIKYYATKKYSEMKIIPLRSVSVKKIEKEADGVTISLKMLDNPGIFIALVPEGSFVVDAIEIFKEN